MKNVTPPKDHSAQLMEELDERSSNTHDYQHVAELAKIGLKFVRQACNPSASWHGARDMGKAISKLHKLCPLAAHLSDCPLVIMGGGCLLEMGRVSFSYTISIDDHRLLYCGLHWG